jgi:cytochrome c oxidase subunit IV
LLRPAIAAGWLRWAVVLSGFAQIAGLALFFHTMWSRIRPVGSQAREAKGERF